MDHHKFSILSEDHIWQGAAKGLTWIHGKGLLYNDLKSANTMYHPEQRIVLVDIGIAAERIQGHFSAGGTAWYIASGYQLRERSFVSDIWSLAIVILFGLRITQLPDDIEKPWNLSKVFGHTTDSLKMTRWLQKVLKLKDMIPRRHDLLRRMLEVDPNELINAKDLVKELQNHKPLQDCKNG